MTANKSESLTRGKINVIKSPTLCSKCGSELIKFHKKISERYDAGFGLLGNKTPRKYDGNDVILKGYCQKCNYEVVLN